VGGDGTDGDSAGDPSDDAGPSTGTDEEGDNEKAGGSTVRRAGAKVKGWAKKHKVSAGVAASVGGSAAIWAASAAKPILLAGKVLGSGGGGFPGGGHGLGQLRHLNKLRKKGREKWLRRLRRLARRGAEEGDDLLDEDDLDWDDHVDDWWDDERAA
jgi:hypothetical protein